MADRRASKKVRRPARRPRKPVKTIAAGARSSQPLIVPAGAMPAMPELAGGHAPFDPSAPPGSPLAPPTPSARIAPVMPVRSTVLFPFAIVPLNVGRPSSVTLLNDVMAGDRTVAVFTQRDPTSHEPGPGDLYPVGSLGIVLRMVRVAEDRLTVLVQGTGRIRLGEVVQTQPYLKANISPLSEIEHEDVETEALMKTVISQFERIVALSPNVPDEAVAAARSQAGPGRVGDFIASLLDLPAEDKQRVLEQLDVTARLKLLTELLQRELQVLEVGAQIQESVRETIDKGQKEFVLRQQMEAIRKELGEGDDSQRELDELKEKIEKAQMPPEVRKEADRELARLQRIPPQAAEYTVARTYLETLCDMPWAISTEDDLDLGHARKVLDEDHYGLDKIKERILEFLVVRRFKKDARTPILCFVGPPGTGKTSLGRSIAKALGRKFVRQSLGGVRDEAEIRGHRRTYIGALPGNIIRGIRRAGSRNPLFMLDEIDKLGADFRGDPSSALLEVLDPEQNSTFMDHYLDVPFDLSQVLFVTTANYLDPVPPALRDRMEVIELSGYTEAEKLEIAKRHLIPKALRENGLEGLGLEFTDEGILKVVREYTREAGLRNFERELANVLRRSAKEIAEGKKVSKKLDAKRVRELLGPEKFEFERATKLDTPGAVLGLAWTPVGGEVLTVEASLMPGSKQLILTGQLGDVMKESAQAGLSYVRSHAEELGIHPDFFEKSDIHLHLPAGAIPKDGPSAGITMCTALVSLLTRRKALPGIAMTGEITLRGRVLKIGGLKEKVLAAHRAGLTTVIIPRENENDLEEIPVDVRTHMIFCPVERIEQVLELALESAPGAKVGARGGNGDAVKKGQAPGERVKPRVAPVAARKGG
ncbi:MAG TPA: endopeptidase La [Candidatus Sulfotelmatobacter sp.]|nr:endopeptidase La [Candidatus Sulfotelmatobacter sp.]